MGGRFQRELKREYLKQFQPELNMGKLDDFFKMANDVMDQVEGVVKPAPQEQKGDPDDYREKWEESWKESEIGWALALKGKLGEGSHGFLPHREAPDPRRAVCGGSFRPEDVGEVKPLDHSKRLVICTSCVIGVMK